MTSTDLELCALCQDNSHDVRVDTSHVRNENKLKSFTNSSENLQSLHDVDTLPLCINISAWGSSDDASGGGGGGDGQTEMGQIWIADTPKSGIHSIPSPTYPGPNKQIPGTETQPVKTENDRFMFGIPSTTYQGPYRDTAGEASI